MTFPAFAPTYRLVTTRLCLSLVATTIGVGACFGQETRSSDSTQWFEKHIRPTLVDHCIRCHGADKQQGGLRLDTREGWAKGGDSGPAIVPGQADSLLLKAIAYDNPELEMPPRGKLPAKTIDAFYRWVQDGAIDPRASTSSEETTGSDSPTVEEGRSFWSFQPIDEPNVPNVNGDSWTKTDIDRFILARRQEAGLGAVEDADPTTLLRRIYFDLIGLPPTPAQIDEFLSDPSPTAYEDVVDQLLESHHFGERWGRHWLDVVRFAESSGGGRTLLFPDAWRYRDYVIDSLNADVPYDQFLTEQIAGDLLSFETWEQRRRNLTATAFLLLGPTNYEMQDKEVLEMDIVDEQLDTIGKSMLGMTLGCARCHDHKFDPIPAHDYYALAGILKSTKSVIHSNVSKWNTANVPLPPAEEESLATHEAKLEAARESLRQATQRWIDAGGKPSKRKGKTANSVDPRSLLGEVVDDNEAELSGVWVQSTSLPQYVGEHYIHDAQEERGRKSVTFQTELSRSDRYEVFVSYAPGSNRSTRVPVDVHHADGSTTVRINQRLTPKDAGPFLSLGVFPFEASKDARVVISNKGTDDGVVIADSVVFLKYDKDRTPLSGRSDTDEVPNQRLIDELAKEVDRQTAEVESLEAASPRRPVLMATTDDEHVGDVHLAIRGVVHQKGPLTPRGVLQVAAWEPFPPITPTQSGRMELAQWIADSRNPLTSRVIVNRVWHWLIGRGLVSTVDNFGSMGHPPTHPELLDHLATTFTQQDWSLKQLIRRIVLSRTYRLSSASNEAAERVDPQNRLLWRMNRKRLRAEDVRDSLLMVSGDIDLAYGGSNIKAGTKIEYGYQFASTRRSVYVPVFRNTLPEIFEVFDFADPNIQRGQRSTSTVASQALLLMNHPTVIAQTRRAAKRLLAETHGDVNERVCFAYRQVLGRDPTQLELDVAVDLVNATDQNGELQENWGMLYQVLFQCLDFRFLD